MGEGGQCLARGKTHFRRGPLPVGARPKQAKKRAGRPERLREEVDESARLIDAEKAALRRMEITGGDEVDLGRKSSGWPEYAETLKVKLSHLRKANITHADDAADALNRMAFKTGSGKKWTPRLIKVAKFMLLGLMTDRVVNSGVE